ncbi:MAG: biopolymer transporter ExbD, partial [Phycisphaerae bacterium]|nr:biopolymer transporter ExbD [Phycisphaerae bacterium]
MKLSVGKKVSYESGPNMTPLVDIVMVLLIFLMIAGTFAGQERYLVSTVPLRQTGAGGATPPPGGFPRDEPLEIHVTSPVPDRFTARVGQYKAESAGELQQAMRQLLQQLVAAGKRPEDLQVV